MLTLPANGTPLWSLIYDGGNGKIVLEQGSQSVASNVSLTPDVWQHLLFTVSGGTNATLYVNGGVGAAPGGRQSGRLSHLRQ
ncbi:hypothetical protein GC175_25680 [bacterium]|nr:hypothetical protein [bacterium]